MNPYAGMICLVKYPFTDKASAKLRPALVAGADNPIFLALGGGSSDQAGMNVNFIKITSDEEPGLYNIIVDPARPEYACTGLPKVSTVCCWNINTIHRGLIERELGKAPDDLMEQVKEKLRLRLQL